MEKSGIVDPVDTHTACNCATTTQFIDLSELILCAKHTYGFSKELICFIDATIRQEICGKE